MFLLLLAIILCASGIVVGTLTKKKIVTAIAVPVAVVLAALSCFNTVPVGHTGVVTTFGRVENYTLDSGAHIVAPWRTVVNMDNRVQKRNVQLPCFSSDIQEVNISYTVNYQIRKSDAMTLYSTVGVSYYDTVIAPNIAESVKVATARYTAEDLVGMRDSLAMEIEKILSDKLTGHIVRTDEAHVLQHVQNVRFSRSGKPGHDQNVHFSLLLCALRRFPALPCKAYFIIFTSGSSKTPDSRSTLL